jgi:hypothetical protein
LAHLPAIVVRPQQHSQLLGFQPAVEYSASSFWKAKVVERNEKFFANSLAP